MNSVGSTQSQKDKIKKDVSTRLKKLMKITSCTKTYTCISVFLNNLMISKRDSEGAALKMYMYVQGNYERPRKERFLFLFCIGTRWFNRFGWN